MRNLKIEKKVFENYSKVENYFMNKKVLIFLFFVPCKPLFIRGKFSGLEKSKNFEGFLLISFNTKIIS